MKTKAVRLHAANDLRLDEFELPEIKEDEMLVKVVSDIRNSGREIIFATTREYMTTSRSIRRSWDMSSQAMS